MASSLRWKELKAGMVIYYRERKLDGTSLVKRVTLVRRARLTGYSVAVAMKVWGASKDSILNCFHTIPANKPLDWSATTGWYYRTRAKAIAAAQGEAAHLKAALNAYERGILTNDDHYDVLEAVAKKYRLTTEYLRDVMDRLAEDARVLAEAKQLANPLK